MKALLRAFLLCAWLIPGAASAACLQSGFEVMSWNVQTFGNIKPAREAVIRKAYEAAVSSNVYVVAVQEVANRSGMDTLLGLLPGGTRQWAVSFEDTPDGQDNAIAYRRDCATVTAEGFLFLDEQGLPDRSKARHPIRWASLQAGAFKWTMLSLHLTFQGGDAASSARELGYVLDWAVERLKSQQVYGDFMIAGDFNLPTEKGKEASKRSKDKKWIPLEPLLKANGAGTLAVFVDEPTSRAHKQPGNNYDHFIVSPALKGSVARVGRVPPEAVDAADHGSAAMVSDHYPVLMELVISTAAAAGGTAE
ncbi:MAG: hypothetical protein GX410_00855 [Elusimicrobia bacterium]|nr:hypothetical protein [Elusimicrobiota bacterium]